MSFRDRFYWFSHNLIRFPVVAVVCPVLVTVATWYHAVRVMFVTDGSETLTFPWE